jgi:hypothetical protein
MLPDSRSPENPLPNNDFLWRANNFNNGDLKFNSYYNSLPGEGVKGFIDISQT